MGERTLYRSICLQLLLITAAIQGATPDAHDLASIKPLWLLCRLVASPHTLLDDDQLPDDVCNPMSAEMDAVVSQHANSAEPAILERLVTEHLLGTRPSAAARSSADRGSTLSGEGVIYTLCRLLC